MNKLARNVLKGATEVASTNIQGSEFSTDLYAHWQELYRTKRGNYVVVVRGGCGVSQSMSPPISREEAIDWIATHAQDAITGYGFTLEQAEVMVDGVNAGSGYRGR